MSLQFPIVILAMIGCSYFHTHTGFPMFTASDYYLFMIESYGQMTFTICCIVLTALSHWRLLLLTRRYR